MREESSMRNGSFDSSKTSILHCNLDPFLDRARLGPTLICKERFYGATIKNTYLENTSLLRTSLRATGDI